MSGPLAGATAPHPSHPHNQAGEQDMTDTETNYKALIDRARNEYASTDSLHRDLADAVQALVAEEQYQRRTKEAALGGLGRYEKRLQKVEAERDALRAQLDGMTTSVEYAYGALDAPDTITLTGEDIDDLGSARYNAEEYWLSVLQRTVKRGPWEVTD